MLLVTEVQIPDAEDVLDPEALPENVLELRRVDRNKKGALEDDVLQLSMIKV